MNKCQMLHETIIKDIVDIISDAKNFDKVEWLKRRNNTGSIAARANNLVIVFPVLVSNSLSVNSAILISKAIERKCVSLLQILFSSMQLTKHDNLYDYIRQFHTNLDTKGLNLDEFIDIMDALGESGMVDITDKEAYEEAMADMKNINFYLSEAYNSTAITDYEFKYDRFGNPRAALKEAKGDKDPDTDKVPHSSNGVPISTKPESEEKKQFTTSTSYGDDARIYGPNAKHLYTGSVTNNYAAPQAKDTTAKDTNEYFRYQLLPQDVQKANELVPTLMIVNFTHKDKDDSKVTVSGIVGVKAKLYPVNQMDVINRIISKQKDSNGLFNFIRATTREISFFKDFAFAIDKAKLDAVNVNKESDNARMFKILERRAAKNKFSRLVRKNNASPITSLVISQDEVEYIKKFNNIDLEKVMNCRAVLEGYNLMDIVVVDESLEIAKFLYDDGTNQFESLPFDALEKEQKDSSYKKVLNLISKINK